VLASVVPTCVAFDPTFGYELAVIVQDGLRRMYQEGEDVFYYLTTMNENYRHPAMPEGVEEGIRRGIYLLRRSEADNPLRVRLLGSGTILREVLAAAELLEAEYQVAADVWSVTSFTQLRRDGLTIERYNRLHPEAEPRVPFVTQSLAGHEGPVVAATDYVKSFADKIRSFVPGRYVVLGTDGFGRSDTREGLRDFFEVDRRHVALAALEALARDGQLPASQVTEALHRFDIDPERPDPATFGGWPLNQERS